MLQASTNDRKTKAEASSKTAEHLPEQEQPTYLPGLIGSRQTQSFQQHKNLKALHKTYGNQAMLRMMDKSSAQTPVTTSPLSRGGILQWKCACGNAAGSSGSCAECQEDGEMAVPGSIQTKLTINEPGDRYEQEADRVAEQVMTMPDPTASSVQRIAGDDKQDGIQTKLLATSITQLLQREAMPEEEEKEKEEEESIQTKPALQGAKKNNSLETGHNLESRLNNSGSGSPLPNDVRSFMEPRFGADFSQVRVHRGGEAVQMNRELNAKAFTHKQDIYFGAGKSLGMNDLTAHELTHVVQQHQSGALFGSFIIQRDADSDSYKQGYQDGLNGGESQVGPRYGDALTDYNEGYAKGHYEFTRSSATPAPATPDQAPTPAPAISGQTETPAPGPTSDSYKQGYQDGLNGGESQVGPRYGDALTDYNKGYAKGHYEFSQRAAPAPRSASTDDSQTNDQAIAQMDKIHKLIAAVKSALIQAPEKFGDQVNALLQPEALLEFAIWTEVFAALQATPAGWGADLAIIGLEAYLIGPLVVKAIEDLVEFFDTAINAQDKKAIDKAGAALADALGILGIDLLMKLLFHGSGEVEPEKAPSGEVEIKPKAEETSETPKEEALLERTANKPSNTLSPEEINTERKIADRGNAEAIDDPPFTIKRKLPNGHEIEETPNGDRIKRCTACAVFDKDGNLVSEETEGHTEEPKANTPQIRVEDVTTGPHGPERPIEDVVARAWKDGKPQGRWLTREAGEKAVADANLDVNNMKPGTPYSIPIPDEAGEVVRTYNEYPDRGIPRSQRFEREPANRAIVIRKPDGIHSFPIGPDNPAYNTPAPTLSSSNP
ncbi:MAG: DUF4157 domain-containing protein [Nostoc sp.]|uniref:eCIS core domain-containing protein n=1 Tax=Nostoc sp. TaxID=1180 RepID=UPI002FF9445E